MRKNHRRIIFVVLLLAVALSNCQNIKAENTQPTTESANNAIESTSTTMTTILPTHTPTVEVPAASETATEEPKSETWMRTYGGRSSEEVQDVLQTEDGGFYVLGLNNVSYNSSRAADIYLFRTDKYGDVMWEKTLTNGVYAAGLSFTYTNNDTILIAGITRIDEASTIDILIMEVDLDGNLLKSTVLEGDMDEWVNTIIPTEDGGAILFGNYINLDDYVTDPGTAGYGGFEYRSSVYAVRVDQNGEKVWSQVFDNGENVTSISAVPAPDGSFYILSTVFHFPDMTNDMLLLKIDAEGNEIWSRIWDEGKISPREFQITTEGNLLIGAMYSASGDPRYGDADYLIMEIDDQGADLWQTIFGTPDMVDLLSEIIETADNGYLIVGDRSKDLFSGDSDLVLTKLDGDREIVWERTLDSVPHFIVSNLSSTEGGYFIAATVFAPAVGYSSDIVLIKTDLEGNIDN